MDLKETEARNDCAGEDQQQFNFTWSEITWSRMLYEYVCMNRLNATMCSQETKMWRSKFSGKIKWLNMNEELVSLHTKLQTPLSC
jgi:hypothetical protein